MARTLETTVYQYVELTPEAQAKARAWFRRLESQDFNVEYVLEDADRMAGILGIAIDRRTVKLYGGGTRQEPDIAWSGFYSQGDGASFIGTYAYKPGALKAITAEAPTDERLHAIAKGLQDVQARHAYRVTAGIGRSSHQSVHEHSVSIDVEYADGADVEAVQEALRDFMRWIYRQLEQEYEYRLSDDVIAETIEANEYEFTVEGGRCVRV